MRLLGKILAVLVMIPITLIPANTFAASQAARTCSPVEGTFVGQAVPTAIGFDVYIMSLTGELSGQPVGDKITTVAVQRTTPAGTVLMTGSHHIVSSTLGELVTADQGEILPNGHVEDLLKIIEGGSGVIKVSGTLNLATGIANVNYWGRVCTE